MSAKPSLRASASASRTADVDTSPIVHSIYSKTTSTWQYVVADRTTKHCIVLDPVRDHCPHEAGIKTEAADAIIDLVKAQGYIVDYILETNAIGSQHLSAAWLLRMHLLDSQGSAPQLCSEASISGLQAMWQRKYGADNKFSTSIRPGLEDGESVAFGGQTLTCIHLPGSATPHRRTYRVGDDVFGAHSIATLAEDMPPHDHVEVRNSQSDESSSRLPGAWTSLDRIVSLPGHTRVWQSACDTKEPAAEPLPTFDLLSQCAAHNKYAGLSKEDFLARRSEETRPSREQERPTSSNRSGGLKSKLGSWIRA
jgi:glyoxylase-like metal-dependent hydrolase (beta-lactamase superfamily II)